MKQFKDTDKIKIRNAVNAKVIVRDNVLKIYRVFEKKNAVKYIDYGVLKELIYNPGFESSLQEGILDIEDMEVKVALGLESEDVLTDKTAPKNIVVLTDEEKDRMLTKMPIYDFKKKVEGLPREQVRELANYAIEKEQIDFSKADVIEKRIGLKVAKAIELKRANEAD